MRVQLSPWRIIDSSLAFKVDDKTRKSSSKLLPTPGMLASVVVDHSSDLVHQNKRKSKRKTKHRPLVSITSPHRITVLTEAIDPNQVRRGDDIQFSSRPGGGFSFLSNDKAPPVAAVFDDLTDRTYALQKNNTKLVCYSTASVGNETESSLSMSATLNEAALDMQLLHLPSDKSCIVYGTCLDGKVFVAQVCENPNGQAELLVEYFGASSRAPVDYVGTVGHLGWSREERTETDGQPSIGKRKRDEAAMVNSNNIAKLFQVTRNETGISLIRHTISFKRKNQPQQGNSWAEAVHSSTPVDVELDRPNNAEVESISVVGLDASSETGSITVMYSCLCKAGPKESAEQIQSYITTVSLGKSVAVGSVVLLPNDPQDVCYVGRSVVAVVTRNMDLVLFDSISGLHLLRQPLYHLLGRKLPHCRLLADATNCRLVILFPHGESLTMASSTVVGDRGISVGHASNDTPFDLADRIRMFKEGRDSKLLTSKLTALSVLPSMNTKQRHATARGLDILQEAHKEIAAGSERAAVPSFLRKTFLSSMQREMEEKVLTNGKLMNGVKNHTKNGKNGRHKVDADSVSTISKISFDFAGTAALVIVRLLLSKSQSSVGTVRQDACFALEQLIKSNHLSARDHLNSSGCSFLRLLQGIGRLSDDTRMNYSPFKFVNDMLDHCSDVSEGQMVASLRYVLVFTDPKDVARFFTDAGKEDCRFHMFSQDHSKSTNGNDVMTQDAATKLAGASWLLNRFISYTSCNESLLRHALKTELTEAECFVLLRLFSSLLRRHGVAAPLVKISNRSLQWVSSLADVVGTNDGARRMLIHIQRSVSKERNLTEGVLRLQRQIREAEEMLQQKSHAKQATTVPAPYQIEHLTF